MKLIRLHLENFRQHAETSVGFPAEGIVGIIGSNESGKSTILEGVAWALYGSKAIRGSKGGIRWHHAPARHVAEATLHFEVGGTRYRVWRSESNAKVWIEGQTAPVAEGTSAVDGYLPERVGMGLSEFAATYMCSQKDLTRLPAMGPTDRQTFVRGVMGLDRIDAALETCRKAKNDLANQVEGLAAGLGDRAPLVAEVEQAQEAVDSEQGRAEVLRGAVEAAERTHEQAAAAARELLERRRSHERLSRELEEAERGARTAAEGVGAAEERIIEARNAAQRLQDNEPKVARLPELRRERDELLAAKASAEERRSLEETLGRLESEVQALRVEASELDEKVAANDAEALSRVGDRYKEAREQLERTRSERDGARARGKAEADQAEQEATKLGHQIRELAKLGEDGPCPTCTRPLGGHLSDVLGALQEARDAATARGKDAARRALSLTEPSEDEQRLQRELSELEAEGTRLREIETRATEARRRLGQARHMAEAKANEIQRGRERLTSLRAVEYSADRLSAVEDVIASLEKLERKAVAGDRIAARELHEHEDDLRAYQEALEKSTADADRIRVELEELDFDPELNHTEESGAERARTRLEQLRQDLARTEERLMAVEHRRDRALEQIEEYDERAGRLGDLRDRLRIHTAAAERLNVFRVEQAGLIRPELEELVTGFISILTDGRHDSVTVTEDFQVVLQEGGIDAEVVSGGTEDIAAIALRLAISQMIAERAGHPLSLLILDEPFGSLDEVRRGNVLNLIRRLSGTFEQVLVISHVAETRDAVDHVIELEYSEPEGRSRVTNSPAPAAEPTLIEGVAAA